MSDLKDTTYIDGVWFSYQGDYQKIEKTLRETLAAAHHFRPSDHDAILVANLRTQLHQFEILTIASRCCSPWSARSPSASPASD